MFASQNKIGLLFLLYLGASQLSFSQVVTTSPQFPTENDSIIVYFDATKGDAGLKDFTGDVYAHTGVLTNLSKDSHDWKYVINKWPTESGFTGNISLNKFIRDSTNHYHLAIGNPRDYYNKNLTGFGSIPQSEHIQKLAFVFRNADGSKTGRDIGGADIFAPLYEPGLTINFDQPNVLNEYGDPLRSPYFINSSDSTNIKVSVVELGTKISTLTLYINGSQTIQTGTNFLNYTFLAANYESSINQIAAVGIDTAGLVDTSSFCIVINPPVPNAGLPLGNKLGINYNSTSSVTLALYAPYKNFVYVIGDFNDNDWKVNTNYLMRKDSVKADSVVWWLTIDNLSPGQEYAFQYLVDGNLRVADPFSHKILDPANDEYISATIYPNLKAYPSGKTSEIVSVLQTDQSQYNWEVTDFKKPETPDLVIYELLVRDFVSSHWYKTVEDTLSYLKRLGINAIELMPVMEFEGNISWGYNPNFHLALDKYYGTPDALKALIDKAHSMGIAVIFDIVLNHTMGSSPFARLYWDSVNNRPAANNPWLNPIPKHDYNVGNDFNHESNQTKYYVDRVTSYWIEEFHIDGYRFDLSKGFTQKNTLGNVGLWGQYDQTRINILERMANKIWEIDSSSILILEHFADNSEEKVLSDFGFLLWGNMNYNYNQATMGYRFGPSGDDGSWNFSGVYFKNRGWTKPGLVSYTESHDEERLMYKNETYGNSGPNYNIKNIPTGLKRVGEAAAFFFTIPGPKMIWQFGELGYDYTIDYNGRTGEKPIRWDYLNNPDRLLLYKTMAALIYLKNNYPVFRGNATTLLSDTLKSIQLSDSSMNVNIIGNFGVLQSKMNPNFQQTGKWYDYFSGDSMDVSNTNDLVSLSPGEHHIYTTVKLPIPDLSVPTGINGDNPAVITNYELEQNYPNPFNPLTTIKYQIPNAGVVTIKIYDLLGREIKTLVNQYEQAGVHKIYFNATGLVSGVYFYQLKANNFVSTRKMILLK